MTDLGAATPTANSFNLSSTYNAPTPQNGALSNGDYLTALSQAQQSAFQAGSFDVYSHPAPTNLSVGTYETVRGYDVVNTDGNADFLQRINLVTSNNLGVAVGTALEVDYPFYRSQIAIFTPAPHTIYQAFPFPGQEVQSPGFVGFVPNASDRFYSQFYGATAGVNDHNSVALTEYSFAPGVVLAPHVIVNNVDTALGGLGGVNGAAYALNNSNQVVGWSQIANGTAHAFLYSNGSMQDLNLLIPPLSGITLISAVGIDAAGEIVAYGTDPSGQMHEYYLSPLVAPVPEPSTLICVGMTIAGLPLRNVRSRRLRATPTD